MNKTIAYILRYYYSNVYIPYINSGLPRKTVSYSEDEFDKAMADAHEAQQKGHFVTLTETGRTLAEA